ncbi:MAG: Eco57I restriction-modification methylase domain-containing protein [Chloroflexales bacterium]
MSISQLPLALAQRHHNRQLFADRYLDETLPRRGAWLDLLDEAAPVLSQVGALLAAFVPSTNESQTEHELVRPVLVALGHTFEVQASLHTPAGTKKPDYVFYRDLAALQANKNRVLAEADLGVALAVGDAKYWERKLDVSSKGEIDEISRVPARQIAFYMLHSGVTWGILTNGRRWRLYHKDTARREEIFYEVDLKDLVEANDPRAFLYFYAFFRRAAFEPPVGDALTLDGMLRESVDYARGVSESLKAQVFDALRHIAQGFLDYPRNGFPIGTGAADPAAPLQVIYANSLIVLYRLLFILYAEARELLPLRESLSYRDDYSLYAMVRDVGRRLDSGMSLLVDTGQTWAHLRDLFGIINLGSPPLRVATFNGGLFDPQRHSFLDHYSVGDAQLQLALDKLARVIQPQTGLREFIDYRDLAERHLGTIYEGLLEYHLEKDDPGPEGFSIALVNDKGERHRTGSYYTPDFVVQYIVEQTLRPVLDAAVAEKKTDAEKIAAVLAVNCVDPAMGSGHFPVAATEYIARYLVEIGVSPPTSAGSEGEESDLAYWKRRVAQSCIYGVDLNPLAVDLAKLSLWLSTAAKGRPLSFLDHHLRCGNALVGTRASELDDSRGGLPLARRSRKVRAKGSPPSPAQGEGGRGGEGHSQLSLLDDAAFAGAMSSAVGSMWLIEDSAGYTVSDVKEQERIYETVRAGLTERFAVHADLATAAGFGAAPERSMWRAIADYAQRPDGAFATPAFERPLEQIRSLHAAQRFFHWDLEFPEVFYDRHGRPLGDQAGFDVVIGNPPYVRQEQLGPLKPFFQQAYAETYSGTADLFVYFFHQGVKLLHQGGLLGYIASNSWLRANYATPLRSFMRQQITVEQVIDLGDNRVFADAPDVYPAIPIVRKATPPEDHTAQAATFSRGEGVKEFESQISGKLTPVSIHDQQDSGWQLGGDAGRLTLAKIMRQGRPIEDVAAGAIYYGIKTGLNEAYIINQKTYDDICQRDDHSSLLMRRMLRAEDLRPWYQEDEGRWLIFIPNRWTTAHFGADLSEEEAWSRFRQRYTGIAEHLSLFLEEIRTRGDHGEFWWELRPCAYLASFDVPKIISAEIGKIPRYSWDSEGIFVNNKAHLMPCNEPWILGILQSRVHWFVASHLCTPLGERAGLIRYQQLIQFITRYPIPDAPPAERETIGALAMTITGEAKARYQLYRRARNRIQSDLGAAGKVLNQKLTAWWNLDFPAFRAEIQKVFKRDIALKERDDWEEWLGVQREKHRQHTAAIIAGEIELNRRVYHLFDLNAEEIAIIETSTKYQYGEV